MKNHFKIILVTLFILIFNACVPTQPKVKVIKEGSSKDNKFTGKIKGVYEKSGNIAYQYSLKNGKYHGEYISYHQNGQIKVKAFSENGVKTGEEKEYYSNGKLHYKTYYKNGKVNGYIKFYHPSGTLKSNIKFIDDLREGDYIIYHENGAIHKKGTHVKDKIEGKRYTYYPSGEIEALQNFKNSKFHGTNYYTTREGVITKISNYKDGLLDGLYLEFDQNGQKRLEVNYKNGLKHGILRKFDREGYLTRKETYSEDERELNLLDAVNPMRSIFGETRKIFITKNINDYIVKGLRSGTEKGLESQLERNGIWEWYDSDNNLIFKQKFYDGYSYPTAQNRTAKYGDRLSKRPEYNFKFDQYGKCINQESVRNGILGLSTEIAKGNSANNIEKDVCKIVKINQDIEFHKNGLIKSIIDIKNGNVNGVFKTYYPNGQLHEIGIFKNNKLISPFIVYKVNGDILNKFDIAEIELFNSYISNNIKSYANVNYQRPTFYKEALSSINNEQKEYKKKQEKLAKMRIDKALLEIIKSQEFYIKKKTLK